MSNIRSIFFSALTVILLTIIGFGFFVIILSTKMLLLYSDAKSLLQNDGYWREETSQSKEYMSFLENVASIRKDFEMLGSSVLIEVTGNRREVNDALSIYDQSRDMLPVLPSLLGKEGSKRYLLAFQNSAEARGTGGIIGAFAVIKIDKGEIMLESAGANSLLQSQLEIPVELPSEFTELYRSDPAIWQNSNLSPHFPYGAEIWLGLWKKQFGDDLDGVVALDPFVLKAVLKEIGDIKVQGIDINAENVVEETLSNLYLRFEQDNQARKDFLVTIITTVAQKILSNDINKFRLLLSINQPMIENRILLYSSNPRLQSVIEKSKLSGALSKDKSNEYRLVVQNTAGNKMDYYLDRSISIEALQCKKERRTAVRVSLTNSVSDKTYLPNYVKGRLDLGLVNGKDNSTAVTAMIYGPPNAQLVNAREQGRDSFEAYLKQELSREVLSVPLELKAGQTRTIEAIYAGGMGKVTTHIQPLVRPVKLSIFDKCN